MATVEALCDSALNQARGWAATARECWECALSYDFPELPMDFSGAVVFSPRNPYVQFYNVAVRKYWEACEGLRTGGYVGLSTKGGRAQIIPVKRTR